MRGMTNQSQQSMDEQISEEIHVDLFRQGYLVPVKVIEVIYKQGIQHERSRLAASKTDEEAFKAARKYQEGSMWFSQESLESKLDWREQIAKHFWQAACAFKNAQQAAKDAESDSRASYNREWMQEAEAEIERLKADNAAKDARIAELEAEVKSVTDACIQIQGDDVRIANSKINFAWERIKALEIELLIAIGAIKASLGNVNGLRDNGNRSDYVLSLMPLAAELSKQNKENA